MSRNFFQNLSFSKNQNFEVLSINLFAKFAKLLNYYFDLIFDPNSIFMTEKPTFELTLKRKIRVVNLSRSKLILDQKLLKKNESKDNLLKSILIMVGILIAVMIIFKFFNLNSLPQNELPKGGKFEKLK